jgi:hypothetical protein
MIQQLVQSKWYGRDLKVVQDNTHSIHGDDVLLFSTLRNEAVRIPYFLEYYRRLGVKHFLFVDNGSTDGFSDLVSGESDISVWYTESSYAAANYGMHWLNDLLRRFGCGHWCVTCDSDEFLVYPHCDERSLPELGEFLEDGDRRSLCCLMLDMYSDRPLAQTIYQAGESPFTIAPFFDGNGYSQVEGWLQDTYTRGGVRRRLFFREDPDRAPALNKTPFVKWRWTYSYLLSMHQLIPAWLNLAHTSSHLATTGCVMHFKYLALLEEKAREEMERGEHWDDSYEYRRYHERLRELDKPFLYEGSTRYSSWRQLSDMGLLSEGQWF